MKEVSIKEIDKIGKRIGIAVSILLLLIGSVYARNSIEESPNTSIGDLPNISIENMSDSNTTEILEEGGVVYKENNTENIFAEGETTSTEKKSSPGFGSIITMIILSVIVVIIKR